MPRLALVVAACLWSLSGPLAKIISLPGPSMAAYRALFAGVFLCFFVKRTRIQWRWSLLIMMVCFTLLNLTFITAMTLTSSANAIFLQCTAPVWATLACVFFLGESLDKRSLASILIGLTGMALIAGGGWESAPLGIALALSSGVFYAVVTVYLRLHREYDSLWLTALNLTGAGLLLFPAVFLPGQVSPLELTGSTALTMVFFGVVQMGIPYLLYAGALRSVSPQEAGVITLIEPVLNPIFTFFFVGEMPALTTMIGGGIVLAAVGIRYLPGTRRSKSTNPIPMG